ncbi:hypothetical protein C8R43DRAFT_1205891 [Mycena crocata]|nr:hypothetical protein C8R43DRAFT_1205891 [Mycena crocata]
MVQYSLNITLICSESCVNLVDFCWRAAALNIVGELLACRRILELIAGVPPQSESGLLACRRNQFPQPSTITQAFEMEDPKGPHQSGSLGFAAHIPLPSSHASTYQFGSQSVGSRDSNQEAVGQEMDNLGQRYVSNFSNNSWTFSVSDIPEEDDDEQAYGETTQFILPPLEDYNRDYNVAMNPDELTSWQFLDLPTLYSRRKIRRNRYIARRREECIAKGIIGLMKPELRDMQVATRRLQRDIFPAELNLLDTILSKVQTNRICDDFKLPPSVQVAYRISQSDYAQLTTMLYCARAMAAEAFQMAGRLLPDIPYFGRTGAVQSWHNENDFEICCVCFRLEVEHFLWDCDQIMDYAKYMPRSIVNMLSADAGTQAQAVHANVPAKPLSPVISPSFKCDIPPHMSGFQPQGMSQSKSPIPVVRSPKSPVVNMTPQLPVPTIVTPQAWNITTHAYPRPVDQQGTPSGPLFQSTPMNKDHQSLQPRVPWANIPDIRRTHAATMLRLGEAYRHPLTGMGSYALPNIQLSKDPRQLNELLDPLAKRLEAQVQNNSVNLGHASHPSEVDQLRKAAGIPLPPSRSDSATLPEHPGLSRGAAQSPNNPFRNRTWTQAGGSPPAYTSTQRQRPATNTAANLPPPRPTYMGITGGRNAAGAGGGDSGIQFHRKDLRFHLVSLQFHNNLEGTILARVEMAEMTVGMEEMQEEGMDQGDLVEIQELKYDTVPTWDGDTDVIMKWLAKVNNISTKSETVFQQLGQVVPNRLTGNAEVWYWSLPVDYRGIVEENWDTLKEAIVTFYINPQKGARPCRHCGSGNHWDPECKHAFKGMRSARANLAMHSDEMQDAQDAYDNLYYGLDSDDESEDSITNSQQDFREPLQTIDCLAQLVHSNEINLSSNSTLEGETDSKESQSTSDLLSTIGDSKRTPAQTNFLESEFHIKITELPIGAQVHEDEADYTDDEIESSNILESLTDFDKEQLSSISSSKANSDEPLSSEAPDSEDKIPRSKPPLNRRSRRRLAQEIEAASYSVHTGEGIDSSSDITLISLRQLLKLTSIPKSKTGQSINLIQVTGTSSINSYVNLDLFFHTPDGPVKINVDAYVVKDMTTPFILGNDFQDQYGISVVREEGETFISFGDSGRQVQVPSSTSTRLVDDEGHTFKVSVRPRKQTRNQASVHRKHQKLKRRQRVRIAKGECCSTGEHSLSTRS